MSERNQGFNSVASAAPTRGPEQEVPKLTGCSLRAEPVILGTLLDQGLEVL